VSLSHPFWYPHSPTHIVIIMNIFFYTQKIIFSTSTYKCFGQRVFLNYSYNNLYFPFNYLILLKSYQWKENCEKMYYFYTLGFQLNAWLLLLLDADKKKKLLLLEIQFFFFFIFIIKRNIFSTGKKSNLTSNNRAN